MCFYEKTINNRLEWRSRVTVSTLEIFYECASQKSPPRQPVSEAVHDLKAIEFLSPMLPCGVKNDELYRVFE